MSIFTRRHYDFLTETTKEIIEALKEVHPNSDSLYEMVAIIIAINLKNESLGFDKELFLANVLPKQP